MNTTIAFTALLLTALFCFVQADSSQCISGQFAVKNGNEEYLVINSAKDIQMCGVNICTEIQSKQTLSLSSDGATLQISDSNSVTLQDPSSTNEIQNLALDSSGKLSISQGNSVNIPDVSPTNEIQTLSFNGNSILLSDGGNVTLPDSSATNELQNLTLTNNTLSIANGNSVDLSYLAKPVLFRASLSVEVSIPIAQVTQVTFDTKTVDSVDGFVTGGLYKVKVPGWYQASTMFSFHVTASAGYYIETHFYVNNAQSFHCTYNAALSSYTLLGTQCTDIFHLQVDDVISVQLWWAGSGSTLSTLVGQCSWTLLKVSD